MKQNFVNFPYGDYLRDKLSVFIQKNYTSYSIIYTEVVMLITNIFQIIKLLYNQFWFDLLFQMQMALGLQMKVTKKSWKPSKFL